MKVIITLLISLLFIPFQKFQTKINNNNKITNLTYSYTTGYDINGYANYSINCTDKCTLIIKPVGNDKNDVVKKALTDKDMENLQNILNKYNIKSWNGFEKYNKNVLDGNSFSLSIIYNDDSEISASGYMAWPDNYKEFKSDFINLFK